MFAALPGIDLSGGHLRGVDLCNSDLTNARFDGTCLVDATVNACEARGSSWVGADATFSRVLAARLDGADLRRADFGRSSLIWIVLDGANLEDARFEKADLTGASLGDVRAAGVDFTHARLNDTRLVGGRFAGASFSNAVLTGTDFLDADLSGADFGLAVFHGARLRNADLTGALLSRTAFVFCEDLAEARGLDRVVFHGPIAIDAATLRACADALPPAWIEAAAPLEMSMG
jgi:uncharacterized protein YjbI with pentapeptide repeats